MPFLTGILSSDFCYSIFMNHLSFYHDEYNVVIAEISALPFLLYYNHVFTVSD